MTASESSHDRFIRVGEKRTKRILKELEILANLSNKSHYSFTEDEVRKIFDAIESQLQETKAQFLIGRSRSFSLR